MSTPVSKLKEHPALGSFAGIAAVLGLSREAVRKWDLIPPEHCPAIEVATGGDYTCEILRDDFTWDRDAAGVPVTYRVQLPAAA